MKLTKPKLCKNAVRIIATDFMGILIGSVILAVGLNMFMVPNMLAPGGISGLAVVVYYLIKFPVGVTIIVLNIPLFIIGYLVLGPRVVIQSLLGTFLFSLAVEITAPLLPAATDDLLLAAVYGGVVMGVGVGLVFRFRGSTGGTGLLSLILAKVWGISPGQAMFWGDLVVLALAIFVFGTEAAMYATLALFVSIKVIDAILEGIGTAKSVIIITRCGSQINEKLLYELGRGVTRLEGQGGYTGEGREVLLCVVGRQQTARLKAIIYEADPGAFVIIGNATEVHGEGFKSMQQG
ncbi:MAG: YitT family protein [Dethiobacteria bacterium]|nr:YitT family protein [Dethiobacteria bacterium]